MIQKSWLFLAYMDDAILPYYYYENNWRHLVITIEN